MIPDDGFNLETPPFSSNAASAFSERYLGLPKPDPRAYTVTNTPSLMNK